MYVRTCWRSTQINNEKASKDHFVQGDESYGCWWVRCLRLFRKLSVWSMESVFKLWRGSSKGEDRKAWPGQCYAMLRVRLMRTGVGTGDEATLDHLLFEILLLRCVVHLREKVGARKVPRDKQESNNMYYDSSWLAWF